MKAKWLSVLVSLAMVFSIAASLAVCVNADSHTLQVCTDAVMINGEGYESTSELSADAWFRLTYDGLVEDEDGSISTFHVRGWVNPLDGSDMIGYGYALNDTFVWDDAFTGEDAGLSGYFPKAIRFNVTVYLGYLPAGTYDFRLYAMTTSGIHEVEDESFTFVKKSDGDVTNVALGKDVYADQSMEAGFFGAAMLTDGTIEPFESNVSKLGWVCAVGDPMLQQQDQEINLIIDLGDTYEVGCVSVWPQLFLDGVGFPSSFTILTGTTMREMTPVAAVENINETAEDSTTDPTVLTFKPVVCRYVDVRVDRASFLQEQDGSYLSEIGEIEVMGKKAATPTYTVTFKDGDTVIATVTYEQGTSFVNVPDVPAKEGYEGAWAEFKLENKDIEVQAVYTAIEAPATEPDTTPDDGPATEPDVITEGDTVADAATEPDDEPATEPDVITEGETVADAATEPDANTAEATAEAGSDNSQPTDDAGCTSTVTAVAVAILALCGFAAMKKRKD